MRQFEPSSDNRSLPEASPDPAASVIGYGTERLSLYEDGLPTADERLKTTEATHVEDALRSRGLWGRIHRYLDIGTCTGRYPRLLAKAIHVDGSIVAIDSNPSCVRFAREKLEQSYGGDDRADVRCGDFLGSTTEFPTAPFELITCMMSTVSHFSSNDDDIAGSGEEGGGADARFAGNGRLQRMLRRCAELLDDDGLLILSAWSEEACASRHFLSLYDERDVALLAQWTPRRAALSKHLVDAGFAESSPSPIGDRLDLWVCALAGGTGGRSSP